MKRASLLTTALFLVLASAPACGSKFGSGASTTPNDLAPNGTLVVTAALTGQNGRSVSGSAAVYRLSSTNEYVVRLEGLSLTSGPNLRVTGTAGGAVVLNAALRSTQGNQNYFTGITATQTWQAVNILSSSDTVTPNYAIAAF